MVLVSEQFVQQRTPVIDITGRKQARDVIHDDHSAALLARCVQKSSQLRQRCETPDLAAVVEYDARFLLIATAFPKSLHVGDLSSRRGVIVDRTCRFGAMRE